MSISKIVISLNRFKKIFFLLLLSTPALFPLVNEGIPITSDGEMHIARLAAFAKSLINGQFPVPRWAADLNFGYGHPVLFFQYPLAGYLGSIFYFIGFSLISSFKLVVVFSLYSSVIFFYFWLKKYLNSSACLIASLLYLYAPYRFLDFYDRLSIGQITSFAILPLVWLLADRYLQIKNTNNFILLSLSIFLLILSHNILSLIFLPFLSLYLLLGKDKFFLPNLLPVIFGLLLSAFFWFPALFLAKYTTRDLMTTSIYEKNFASFYQLFTEPGKGSTFNIGYFQFFGIIAGFILFFKNLASKYKQILVFCLFGCFIGIFMLLPVSMPFWKSLPILQLFQYPLRFISLTVFFSAVCFGIFINFLRPSKIITIILIFLIIAFSKFYYQPVGYKTYTDNYFFNYTGTTTLFGENNTIWTAGEAKRKYQFPVEIITGKGEITNLKIGDLSHTFKVSSHENLKILDNTVYFPGWFVYLNNKNTLIEFQDINHRGLITFSVPKGQHDIRIIFKRTKLLLFSDLVSFSALLLLSVLYIISLSKKRKMLVVVDR